MPTVTEAFNGFLTAQIPSLPGGDLIQRYLDYGGATTLETQTNVSADGGDPVEGRRNTWTDGLQTWFHIRIPKNAMTEPEWNDYELRWPPELHAEAIGSTGWEWKALRSRWVGFDFDTITGHAKGVGVTDEELQRVREKAEALPYVEVRRSTGGKGLHLYVLFDDEGIPTANHTEHAAVGRCVLGMMTAEVGFDFSSAIDACGGNMWIWRRDITRETQGLALLKAATKVLSLSDLPANWRDHIAVVTRRTNKVKLQGVTGDNVDPFDELTSARRIIPLDDTHKAIIQALMDSGFSTLWIQDHHLLQTHTKALEKLMNDAEARGKFGLVGHFQTNSPGTDKTTPNCFLFPLNQGGWRVYRFSPGVNETDTWVQDGAGWTTCYFNRLPDVDIACRSYGGVRIEGKQFYTFPSGHDAIHAAEALGQKLDIPVDMRDREVQIRVNGSYLTVYLTKDKKTDDSKTMKGWVKKRDYWVRDLDKKIQQDDTSDIGIVDYDNIIRSMRSPAGEVAGWFYRTDGGDWSYTSASQIKLILQGKGKPKNEAEVIMGQCAGNPWKLVSQPFQDEYPGGRCWNQGAPQLAFVPVQLGDDEQPQHPHWDLILNHVGTELTPVLQKHGWGVKHGVITGAHYLLLWIASLIRDPFKRTPYLFLHGNENSGKSIFYEAISILMTKGVIEANKAITTTGDFNGELAGAVLCYIEEIDVAHHKVALPRIKNWTMAEYMSIRQMRRDQFSLANTTHWVQVANHREYCPIFGGDTRITAIQVPDLLPEQDIPKEDVLKPALRAEAPHFLHTLLNVYIPPAAGRLALPVIETDSKLEAIELRRDLLDDFITARCERVEDESAVVNAAIFYDAFLKWLPQDARAEWTMQKVGQRINCPRFRSKGTTVYQKLILKPETEENGKESNKENSKETDSNQT